LDRSEDLDGSCIEQDLLLHFIDVVLPKGLLETRILHKDVVKHEGIDGDYCVLDAGRDHGQKIHEFRLKLFINVGIEWYRNSHLDGLYLQVINVDLVVHHPLLLFHRRFLTLILLLVVRILTAYLIYILLKIEDFRDQSSFNDEFCLIQKESARLIVLNRVAAPHLLLWKDKVLLRPLDFQEGVVGLFDLGEDDGVKSVLELVIDLKFLDLDGLFGLLDEVALLLLLPHLTEPVLLNILNILHVDEHDLFDAQGVRVDDREVEVLNDVLPVINPNVVVVIYLQVMDEVDHWVLQRFNGEVDLVNYVAVQKVTKQVCPIFQSLLGRVKFENLTVFKVYLNFISARD
jgi:hypothetical protein